ncbi:MAG TPA: outer membrane protein assembly factor BamE [Longimicrobiaceae bacterium]|nr:outer membrane protein assembly factor BamE [Longimicrobiaceae bacterium]
MQTSKLLFLAAGLAVLLPSAPAAAQTVRAGMTESQVRSALGEPAATRRSDDGWSYLFYLNGCAVRCGSDDVVFLQGDRVVTAVFRTGRRRFAGPAASSVLEGSSAAPARPAASSRARAVEPGPGQATVTGIRMTLPGSEDMSVGGGQAGAGASGRSGITVYPDEARRQEMAPVAPRGVIIIRDALGTETVQSDSALDRTRQERERNVTPRTVRPDNREAPVADPAMVPAIRERERAVAPRTVRPRPR